MPSVRIEYNMSEPMSTLTSQCDHRVVAGLMNHHRNQREASSRASRIAQTWRRLRQRPRHSISMSCHVMSRHVVSRHVMSCHVMSCHVLTKYVTCSHATACLIMTYHIITYRAVSFVPHHAVPCHHMSAHTTSHPARIVLVTASMASATHNAEFCIL